MLRDGLKQNVDECKDYPRSICPAELSFRNADSIAFVAAGEALFGSFKINPRRY